MATTQTIDATIFASTHPDIAKRISVSGVLISSVMLLIGILAFASTFELDDKSSTTSLNVLSLSDDTQISDFSTWLYLWLHVLHHQYRYEILYEKLSPY